MKELLEWNDYEIGNTDLSYDNIEMQFLSDGEEINRCYKPSCFFHLHQETCDKRVRLPPPSLTSPRHGNRANLLSDIPTIFCPRKDSRSKCFFFFKSKRVMYIYIYYILYIIYIYIYIRDVTNIIFEKFTLKESHCHVIRFSRKEIRGSLTQDGYK